MREAPLDADGFDPRVRGDARRHSAGIDVEQVGALRDIRHLGEHLPGDARRALDLNRLYKKHIHVDEHDVGNTQRRRQGDDDRDHSLDDARGAATTRSPAAPPVTIWHLLHRRTPRSALLGTRPAGGRRRPALRSSPTRARRRPRLARLPRRARRRCASASRSRGT